MSPADPQVEPDAEALDALAIQRGAVRGASVLVTRSIVLQLITAGATIALARLLSPADYGAFAIAFAVQTVGRAVVEIGLPVAFIRRAQAPTPEEERALTGLLLLTGSAVASLALAIAFVGLPEAGAGSAVTKQVAVALCALPIFALRAVPAILLERRLAFGRLVVIEVSETISFYAFAVPTAVAGLGAWSLVGALPCSALVGVVVAMIVRPWRLAISLDLALLRPVMAFGAQAAALWPIDQLRELGVVTALAALGGQSLAGFYGMSQRLLSIPKAIQYAVWRVSVAGFSREATIERRKRAVSAVAVTLLAVALPLCAIAGAAQPLIATLFGERWVATSTIVIWAVPGTLLTIGLWGVLSALALAEGDARSPLASSCAGALTGVLLAAALASRLDTVAAGISITAGALVAASLILIRTTADARECSWLAVRLLVVLGAATGVGQLASGGQDALGAVVAMAAASASWLCLGALIARDELLLLFRLLRRHVIPGLSEPRRGEPQPSSV